MLSARYLRFGLRRSYLSRRPVASRAARISESLRLDAVYISPKTFGLKIERVVRANVRGSLTGHSGETNAHAKSMFSRQRAASRCCRGAVALYGYVLVQISNQLKALGISGITAGRE